MSTLSRLILAHLVLQSITNAFFLEESSRISRRKLYLNTTLHTDRRQIRHVTESRAALGGDKSNIKLENGAKLWQQSMSQASVGNLSEVKHLKPKEIAHSEPLKFERTKETAIDSNMDYEDGEESNLAGSIKAPPCAANGRHYCSYKENYPAEVVAKIAKYYKYPLESMFKDLQHQVMPTLAKDSAGGLVCDTATNLIRVGWAMNTNGRWLVVLNTDLYQQYVTEVVCRYSQRGGLGAQRGSMDGANCNFVPPCYRAKCVQRYNTQKLLVVDPSVPHKGPFLSEFIFPSCCVCFIEADKSYLIDEKRRA